MRNLIKSILKSNYYLYFFSKKCYNLYLDIRYINGVKIVNNSPLAMIRKFIRGRNNTIIIGKGCLLEKTLFRMVGNNNVIQLGNNVTIKSLGSIWTEGNNCRIVIEDNCTFTGSLQIIAQENNSTIYIGNDCMFSNHIIVQTSDSHKIYDIETKKRTNPAKNIWIGDHVWIGPGCRILRGVTIGSNSIIGSGSIVTKEISENVTAVGSPAKVVRQGITWTRERLW